MARELPETPLSKSQGTIFSHPTFQAMLVLFVAVVGGALFITRNQQPSQRAAYPVSARPSPSSGANWRMALENQLEHAATAFPTLTPTLTLVPTNTLFPTATSQIVSVDDVEGTPLPTFTPNPDGVLVATAEFRGSTPVPSPTGIAVADAGSAGEVAQFQPPAEQIPLSLQPNDHFFMRRPVDASANGESLFYYPYGAGGADIQIHHGIDIPNETGSHVLAAADGTVIYSGQNLTDDDTIEVGTLEVYSAYGNMVVIEHDFYVEGQRVWTLYAHMSARLVEAGTRVKMGDIIGLVGETGFATGAHVHFEVRVGVNNYWNTRNPLLWIAPYLNSGVVAGRVIDNEGNFVENALIQINRGGRRVDSTTSYLRTPGTLTIPHSIPDDNWAENFAMSDVPVGEYQVVVVVEGRRYAQSVNVRAGLVNFLEFQIDPPEASTPLPIDEGGGE